MAEMGAIRRSIRIHGQDDGKCSPQPWFCKRKNSLLQARANAENCACAQMNTCTTTARVPSQASAEERQTCGLY